MALRRNCLPAISNVAAPERTGSSLLQSSGGEIRDRARGEVEPILLRYHRTDSPARLVDAVEDPTIAKMCLMRGCPAPKDFVDGEYTHLLKA